MARPQKQTVDYFPHDSSASQGDTLSILQGKWGNDGYAFWFRLLEKLCSSEGHVIDCSNPVKWGLLLAKTQLNNGTGEEIMNTLVELEAIDPDLWRNERKIWCQKLVDNIADAYRNRRRPVPKKPVSTVRNTVTTVRSSQTKLNKTILNNTKKKDIVLPEWIDKELWDGFLTVRKEKKAASTEYALSLIIKDLEKFKASGEDPNEILKRSITNSWKGVFPMKEAKGGAHQQGSRQLPQRDKYHER